MAEENSINNKCYDLYQLLSSNERDVIIRNNGDQVQIKDLIGKTVGLYFSASWCPPCSAFTPILIEVYEQLFSKGKFEVVFISSDRDVDSFNGYFSKMPWFAIPFSDSSTKDSLDEKFGVTGIPHLVILNGDGKVLTDEGVGLVREYEADAYPFTPERVNQLKEADEEAKRNQSLNSLLVSRSRDYLISSGDKKVPVSELEGKIVGLYFCVGSYRPCTEFTEKLGHIYNKLKEKGENFEIVLIYLAENDESGFTQTLAQTSWRALPFKDKKIGKLARYFELRSIPRLVIIGMDGTTLNPDVTELVDEHGINAYPFTPEKLAQIAEIEKAKRESQTLESVLVSGDLNYVVDKSGSKVLISELIGKHILLYFSAHWCPPCRGFTPKLIKTYNEIKAKEDAFEIIFISSDRDQLSFEDYYSSMPWLALPFGDERKSSLSRLFKQRGIPFLVAVGPTGKTVATEARQLVESYGAEAFPFTDDHILNVKNRVEEIAKGWPGQLRHEIHEHELLKVRRDEYVCDMCDETGHSWSFYCRECDFDLHPKCAMENCDEAKDDDDKIETKPGYVCEGDVCRRVV
ncbi:hypothetical protein RND81_11G015600 [Saponaria officinalis]|uniref:protein-disulfide reductase n=1 Tax=Saponaria officinalis TaxID=3572 RepID=A0AAW1HHJ7_SAPOF